MDRDDMKHIIIETLSRFETDFRDPAKMIEHLHDDCLWTIAGETVMSGTRNKAEFTEMLDAFQTFTDTGMQLRPTAFIIEGNRAAVQGDSYMKLKDGREYINEYHWYFEFCDGKIYRVKEYLDTARIRDVFGG